MSGTPISNFALSSHAQVAIREREIDEAWIKLTLLEPQKSEPDSEDPELFHYLRVIPEFGGRVLRVIVNYKKVPVSIVTAFFDRSMKGKL